MSTTVDWLFPLAGFASRFHVATQRRLVYNLALTTLVQLHTLGLSRITVIVRRAHRGWHFPRNSMRFLFFSHVFHRLLHLV